MVRSKVILCPTDKTLMVTSGAGPHRHLLCAVASLALSSSRFASAQATSALASLDRLETGDGRTERLILAKRKLTALNAIAELLLAGSELQLTNFSPVLSSPNAEAHR